MRSRIHGGSSVLLLPALAAVLGSILVAPAPSTLAPAEASARAASSCTFQIPCSGVSVSVNFVAASLPPDDSGRLSYVLTVINLLTVSGSYQVNCSESSVQFGCPSNLGLDTIAPGGQLRIIVPYWTKGLGTFRQTLRAVNQNCDAGKCDVGGKWYWDSASVNTQVDTVRGVPIGVFLTPGVGQWITSADTILTAFNDTAGVDSTTYKLYLDGVDQSSSAHRTRSSIYLTGVALSDTAHVVSAYGCALNGRCDSIPRVTFFGKDPPTPYGTASWLADDSLPPPAAVTNLELPGALPQPPDSLKGCPVNAGDPTFVFNGSYLSQPNYGSFPAGLIATPLGSSANPDTVLEIVTSNHDYLPTDTASVCSKWSYLPDTAYDWGFWNLVPTPQSDSMWAAYPYGDNPVTQPGGGGPPHAPGGAPGTGSGGGIRPPLLNAGAMDPDSVEIWLNGVQIVRNGAPTDSYVHLVQNIPLTADYKISTSEPAMNLYDFANPAGSPNGGWNELIASMSDSTGHRTKQRTRFIHLKPLPLSRMSMAPMRDFSKVEQSQCYAFGAFQCGGVVLTQTIPGFISRDRDRSLHLVYRSSSQHAPTVIPILLTVGASQQPPDSFIVFSNATGSSATDTLHYYGLYMGSNVPQPPSRPGLSQWTTQAMVLGAQLNPPDTGTARIRSDSVVVRARYGSTVQDNPMVQEVTQIYLTDSNTTRVGPGWALAEQSRLIFGQQSHGDTAAIWLDGDGSYEIFLKVNHLWVSPAGETAHLYDSTSTSSQPAAHVLYFESGATVAFRAPDGRQVWTADLLGNRTRYVYASATSSRLDSIVDPSKLAYRFKYNTSGNGTNLVSDIVTRDSAGDTARIATLSYNSANQLRSVTIWRSSSRGDSTRFAYQSNRFNAAYVDSIYDPRSTSTTRIVSTFSYDTILYSPIAMTRPQDRLGTLTEWFRDAWRRAVPTDSFGRTFAGSHQPQSGLIYASQLRATLVDFAHQPIDAIVDKFGGPTWVDAVAPQPIYLGGFLWSSQGSDDIRVITRDTVGRVTRIVQDPDSSAYADSVMYRLDARGKVDTIIKTTAQYPDSGTTLDTTVITYDSLLVAGQQWCLRLKTVMDPMKGTETITYPTSGVAGCLPTKTQDMSGDTTHYTYGTLSAGVTSGVRPVSIGDATGVVTQALYSANNWNTSTTIRAAATDTSRIYYDHFGRPDSSFDGMKARTVTYHDLSGRLTAARTGTGSGAPTSFSTRDAAGNVTRILVFAGGAGSGSDTVPIGGTVVDTTLYYYNNLSQLDSSVTPGHRKTAYVRDARGAPLWEYTGNGSYIFRFYDWQGRGLYENTSPTNPGFSVDGQPFAVAASRSLYQSIGLAPGATLSNGQVHYTDYDGKGRVRDIRTRDLAMGDSLLRRGYGYSRTNQVVADTLFFTDGITIARAYQYNRRGQRKLAISNVTPTTGVVSEPIDTTHYYYDSSTAHLDSIIERVDSSGTSIRLAKVRWQYDLAQRDTVRGILVGNGTTELKTRYQYDSAGNLKFMQTSTPAGTWYRDSSTLYDAVGRLVRGSEIGPCGATTPTCHVTRTDTATYDPLGTGRMTYSSNTDADYTWSYDTWGNRLIELSTVHIMPTSATSDTSTYAVDNSLSRTSHTGTGGLINHFYSDQAGNRLMQRDSSNAGGIDYGVRYAMSYTAKNQLFFSAVPSTQSGGGFDIAWNWYDAAGRRVITQPGYETAWNGGISPQTSPGSRTYYVYDGADAIMTLGNVSGTWKVLARYITGGVDQPVAGRFVNVGGTVAENLGLVEDKQGTTLAAMKDSGTQESNAIYYGKNAFGSFIVSPGSGGYGSGAVNTQTGFAGASTPSQGTGFTYLRNRWYDPQTGRFLTQDPIGLAGGVNLYAYAGNNPIAFADPFGLLPAEGCCDGGDGQDNSLGARAAAALHRTVASVVNRVAGAALAVRDAFRASPPGTSTNAVVDNIPKVGNTDYSVTLHAPLVSASIGTNGVHGEVSGELAVGVSADATYTAPGEHGGLPVSVGGSVGEGVTVGGSVNTTGGHITGATVSVGVGVAMPIPARGVLHTLESIFQHVSVGSPDSH
jgi:RHS repeat-associated protein